MGGGVLLHLQSVSSDPGGHTDHVDLDPNCVVRPIGTSGLVRRPVCFETLVSPMCFTPRSIWSLLIMVAAVSLRGDLPCRASSRLIRSRIGTHLGLS